MLDLGIINQIGPQWGGGSVGPLIGNCHFFIVVSICVVTPNSYQELSFEKMHSNSQQYTSALLFMKEH